MPRRQKVGSRMYRERVSNVAQTARTEKKATEPEAQIEGRLVFVQSSTAGFQRLLRQMDRQEGDVRKLARDEIRRVERFDILAADEQIAGFGADWKGGRVELVLHPARTTDAGHLQFVFDLFEETGIERSQSQHYGPTLQSPTFNSMPHLTPQSLNALAETNPLRSAPLEC